MLSKGPPSQITLAYRVIGEAKTHVFTSEQVPGLHIGSECPELAFNDAIAALGELVSHKCGYEVVYKPVMTFQEFWDKLAKRDLSAAESLLSKYVVAKKEEMRV